MGTVKKELCFFNGNNKIYGEIYLPAESGSFPAAILSHGYNSSHMDLTDLAEKLATRGFAAYVYDFCGGSTRSKSGGSSVDMSVKTECTDLCRVIDGIQKSDFYDGKNLFLYGESQGGFVSGLIAADMPEKITALAMLYPAFCIPEDWSGRAAPEQPEIFELMGMDISRKFALDLPEYDVFEHMKKYSAPTVIFHGDNDTVVSISYSEKLFENMENCELLVYEGEGHGFFPDARDDMTDKAVQFFTNILQKEDKK